MSERYDGSVYVLFNESEGLITDLFDNPEAAEEAANVTGDTIFGPYEINSTADHYK